MVRKISISQLADNKTRIALMSVLEIMPLKFPYSRPAQPPTCSGRILQNLFCIRTKWIWIPKRKSN